MKWLMAFAFVAGSAHAQPVGQTFLHSLELQSLVKGPIVWADVQLELVVADSTEPLPLFLRRAHQSASDGGVFTVAAVGVAPADAVEPRHRKDSWVIDYREKKFAEVISALQREVGAKPSVEQLTAFTRRYISRPSYRRGFETASKVALTREGDCSEYAVLLTAVLRHQGIPARVLFGAALLRVESGAPAAFGHAWTEAFVNGAWHVADAALPEATRVAYLPTAELTNEGPSFLLSVVPAIQALGFKRLVVVPKQP